MQFSRGFQPDGLHQILANFSKKDGKCNFLGKFSGWGNNFFLKFKPGLDEDFDFSTSQNLPKHGFDAAQVQF